MFVPMFMGGSRGPSGEEIAKAWWKEKDRRDKEAQLEAERKEREEKEAKEEAQFWEELTTEMVFQAEEDKKKPTKERYAEAQRDGDIVAAAILYGKLEKEGKK